MPCCSRPQDSTGWEGLSRSQEGKPSLQLASHVAVCVCVCV